MCLSMNVPFKSLGVGTYNFVSDFSVNIQHYTKYTKIKYTPVIIVILKIKYFISLIHVLHVLLIFNKVI